MADILDEIQQDLQEERYVELWQRYGNWVLGALLAIIIATAGAVWWNSNKEAKSAKQGDELLAAMIQAEEGKHADAVAAYAEVAAKGKQPSADLARLRQAALLIADGKMDEATALYKEVMNDASASAEVREIGEFFYVNQLVNSKQADAKEIEEHLQTLSREDGPWRFSAQELMGFYLLGQGNKTRAADIFKKLADENAAPPRIRQRAREMVNATAS